LSRSVAANKPEASAAPSPGFTKKQDRDGHDLHPKETWQQATYTQAMNELHMVKALTEHTSVFQNLLNEGMRTNLAYEDFAWGSKGFSEGRVKELIESQTSYLATFNDQIVGTVSLQWQSDNYWGPQPDIAGYLHRLVIKQDFRGQGHGEQIIDWASNQVHQNGKSLLRLDCDARNTKLCAYYKRQRFTKARETQIPKLGDYIAALFQSP
jgi:ribosomal protein S18 acetylase RimI-like enzyme